MIEKCKAGTQTKKITFGAKPIWETSQNIVPYIDKKSGDRVRKDNYEKAKDILNRYTRILIEEVTADISKENMYPTYEAIQKAYIAVQNNKNKNTVAKYERLVADYKNHIVEVIKRHAIDYQILKNPADLFNEKKSRLITAMKLTEEEREIICSYHNMTKYFSRYFTSLSSVILCGTKKGSISERIIENMEIYFKNEQTLNMISENYSELYKLIISKNENMDITQSMSQPGIDAYNRIIGDIKCEGINNYIAQYKRTHRTKIPYLKRMSKIPLAEKGKQKEVHIIETEEELAEVMHNSIPLVKVLIRFAKECIVRISKEDKKQIYLSEKGIYVLSYEIYGTWNMLASLIEEYYKTNDMKKEETGVTISIAETAMDKAEEKPNCTIIQAVKKMLEEAASAEDDIDAIVEIIESRQMMARKEVIKQFYDKLLLLHRVLNIFNLEMDNSTFIMEINSMQEEMEEMDTIYNMIRNFCTRKPVQVKKWPLYFNKSTFLSSMDADKFQSGQTLTAILRKDGLYYVMIMNPEYSTKPDSRMYTEDGTFEQLVYKQLNGVNKAFPRIFLTERYHPTDEIKRIVKEKLYTKEAGDREALTTWIEYCIESFYKNEDWCSNYHPVFRKPEEYETANEFYTETENSLIRMEFSKRISEDYLRKAVKDGKIFLFQIYNRDFSPYHKGKDDIYTRILKELFSEENLRKLNNTRETAIKLASGGSELIFRPASIPYRETHPANHPIANKNPLNQKKESVFQYPICKDKRYMRDSYTISLVVQTGYRNEEVKLYELNRRINQYVMEEKPNVITIKAGERHLLYYMVNENDGRVLEEGSLNIIHTKWKDGEIKTDYKDILQRQEAETVKEREKWNYSRDIRNIRSGYISSVINQIVQLQQKYNAVIMVEDLNKMNQSGKNKSMNNTYQQFQKALLQKYSCFVPSSGKYCDALQLACPVNSFEELTGQNGIIYFINPSYTSNADPATGFINQFSSYFVYENMKKAEQTFGNISDIQYDEKKQEYVVYLNEKSFGISEDDKEWALHLSGYRTIYRNGKYEYYDCTVELDSLYNQYNCQNFTELKKIQRDKFFYHKFFEIITVLLRMQYTDTDSCEDYMLSPIEGKDGRRFDTRINKTVVNATAVKALMIYLKGVRDIRMIDKETLQIKRSERKSYKEDWIEYIKNCKPYY